MPSIKETELEVEFTPTAALVPGDEAELDWFTCHIGMIKGSEKWRGENIDVSNLSFDKCKADLVGQCHRAHNADNPNDFNLLQASRNASISQALKPPFLHFRQLSRLRMILFAKAAAKMRRELEAAAKMRRELEAAAKMRRELEAAAKMMRELEAAAKMRSELEAAAKMRRELEAAAKMRMRARRELEGAEKARRGLEATASKPNVAGGTELDPNTIDLTDDENEGEKQTSLERRPTPTLKIYDLRNMDETRNL
ncbi:hypothetical protein LTR97_001484 [Elasticomyces elasticus]|uniref:Uncharacterized protein n=1 Tax=Elasticomyces elasticus TaxID=574655 RepID=A0AAN7ZVY2_9PEZI|nr:hypothetical protein LTR97_001484 [Elasticomyces elasticus]